MNHNQEPKGLRAFLRDRGYAAALILCAAAIAVGGTVYYRSSRPAPAPASTTVTTPHAAVPQQTRPASGTHQDMVPAIGTEPVLEIPAAPALKPGSIVCPVEGTTTASYSMDRLAYNETTRDWRVHNGLDLAAEAGTEVKAAADGTVVSVERDDTLGTVITLRHAGGYTTTYASLDQETLVEAGDSVSCGEAIGYVGLTALTETAQAPHVHFTAAMNGEPMDPEEFLGME